ncbi:MAG TPA: TMEM175 family protein [Puia sp.]|nr:TMEM175 family protein [Puia sp.]
MSSTIERQLQKDTSRIEAFSDGIFCVAITLLAIEIGVEAKADETNNGLAQSLIHLWPKYIAYIISFVNVLLAWIGHHGMFKNLRNTDNFVMMSNGFLLMLVALVPFPTKTLGLFLLTGAFKTAVVFYSGYFVLISIAFRLLWHAASRKRELLVHHITETEIKKITKNENIGLVCNSIIIVVAFVNPWLALILSFVMWIYWMVFA